jgi:hypothetical protein
MESALELSSCHPEWSTLSNSVDAVESKYNFCRSGELSCVVTLPFDKLKKSGGAHPFIQAIVGKQFIILELVNKQFYCCTKKMTFWSHCTFLFTIWPSPIDWLLNQELRLRL